MAEQLACQILISSRHQEHIGATRYTELAKSPRSSLGEPQLRLSFSVRGAHHREGGQLLTVFRVSLECLGHLRQATTTLKVLTQVHLAPLRSPPALQSREVGRWLPGVSEGSQRFPLLQTTSLLSPLPWLRL